MLGSVAKVEGKGIVEETLSLGTECRTRWSVDTTQSCTVYAQRNKATIQATFHMRVLNVVSECNCGTSSRIVYVCDDVETGDCEMLVFYFL